MQKINPFLWFNNEAEEAARFYTSIFNNSKIVTVARYGDAGPGPKDSVMVVHFELNGQEFVALNGGPTYRLTPAFSLVVNCETQEEVDYYWDRLLADGGKPVQCGWLEDKYGLSWQVTPTILTKKMAEGDPVKSQRMFKKMMEMVKLDIQPLQDAYDGK
jgi:predicted 3-demethylubiquinone-9 3-methyltransferase (glyoxalase superfamily)